MTDEDDTVWQGGLKLPSSSTPILDICLRGRTSSWHPAVPKGDMDVLAFIQPSLVPWHLVTSPPLRVVTKNEITQEWFSDILLYESIFSENVEDDDPPWFEMSIMQSRVGVLARPKGLSSASTQARITEILFYAEKSTVNAQNRLPTPPMSSQQAQSQERGRNDRSPELDDEISVRALLLSSDLQHTQSVVAPVDGACFLPSALERRQATAAEVSKKRLGMIFDEASERRKRVRHGGGQNAWMAASSIASFDQQRLQDEEMPRPLARPPTVLHPRRVQKGAARVQTAAARPGSRKQSSHDDRPRNSDSTAIAAAGDESTMSQRNKEAVSRIVMAGMRIHGLTQPKGQNKTKFLSEAMEENTEGRDREAEYKGIYHQTYRGALFAFRRDVDKQLLASDAVGDVVDRLLAIFCHEPP